MATHLPIQATRQRFTATIKDENGAVIPGTALDSLTVTFYDKSSGAIINGRDAQSLLGVNGGSVSASGVLTWIMEPDDNEIQSARVPVGGTERHVALFSWTYDADGQGYAEEIFDVQRLGKVA